MFLDHTQRRTTVGRTPLDEWSARRRDHYLTTHDTHNRQISMPPVGFEPTISAGERPQATRLLRSWVRTEPQIACCAAFPRREKHSCHHPTTAISGSRSEWLLAVPYSENGPQGDAFRNHGGHQMEYDGRTAEDSKRSLPPVLPTMAGSMEQVCVCARVLF